MRAPLLLLGGIVVLSLAVARALSCVCSPLECDILTNEDCPGGLTWDPCRYRKLRLPSAPPDGTSKRGSSITASFSECGHLCALSYSCGKISTPGRISRRKHEFNIFTRQFCTGLFAILRGSQAREKIYRRGGCFNKLWELFFSFPSKGKTNTHMEYIGLCYVIRMRYLHNNCRYIFFTAKISLVPRVSVIFNSPLKLVVFVFPRRSYSVLATRCNQFRVQRAIKTHGYNKARYLRFFFSPGNRPLLFIHLCAPLRELRFRVSESFVEKSRERGIEKREKRTNKSYIGKRIVRFKSGTALIRNIALCDNVYHRRQKIYAVDILRDLCPWVYFRPSTHIHAQTIVTTLCTRTYIVVHIP